MKRKLRRWFSCPHWLVFLGSFFGCDLILAAESNPSSLWDMFSDLTFTPSTHDASVRLLAKLFGSVPGISGLLDAGGDTLIGLVLGLFNTGILAISGVFLSYTITKILTETSMDGSTMGKNSTIWTAIRCSLGTSLVVPTTGGYSIINGIVMWVVLQGVGLANMVWGKAVEALNTQNHISTSALVKNSDTDHFSADLSLVDYGLDSRNDVTAQKTNDKNVGVSDLLRSLCCSCAVRRAISSELVRSSDRDYLVKNNLPLYGTTSINGQITYSFPVISDTAAKTLYDKRADNSKLTLKKIKEYNGACGQFILNADSSVIAGYDSIIKTILSKLSPIATSLIDGTNGKDPQKPEDFVVYRQNNSTVYLSDLRKEGSYIDPYKSFLNKASELNYPLGVNTLLETALQYQATATALNKSSQASKSGQDLTAEMTKNGWINAGSYYQNINDLKAALADQSSIKRLTTPKGEQHSPQNNDALFKPSLNNTTADNRLTNAYNWIYRLIPLVKLRYKASVAASEAPNAAPSVDDTSLVQAVQNKISLFLRETSGSNAKIIASLVAAGISIALNPIQAVIIAMPLLTYVLDEIFTYSANTILTAWNENAGKQDPILRLKHLGDAMMTAAVDGFQHITKTFTTISSSSVAGGAVYRLIAVAAAPASLFGASIGTVDAMNGWSDFFHEVATLLQSIIFVKVPLLLAILGPIFVSGVILAVYIPAIPYLLFLFGALSWILAVLIVMVAAPVICFLMLWGGSSQDNPFLSREAEQFIMQLLGVFLRPTLMIVGLIAGVFIARAGVDLLNLGFEQFFNMILDGANMTEMLPQIKLATVMVIYTFIMVSVVNMSFSAIHLLYSETMRIAGINSPVNGYEERQLESIKGSVQKFNETGISGTREGISNVRHGGKFNSHAGSDRTRNEEKTKTASQGSGKGAGGTNDAKK